MCLDIKSDKQVLAEMKIACLEWILRKLDKADGIKAGKEKLC